MGCSSSSSTSGPRAEPMPDRRRRLSVSGVDETEPDPGGPELEQDRGLISELGDKDIVAMLNDAGLTMGRKMSVGSNMDTGKTSFANKSIQRLGEKLDPTAAGIGFTCRKGLKPESPNQDSWFVLRVEGDKPCSIYAVFDGHGKKGHDVSNFVKETLPKLIVRDPRFMTDDMPAMLVDAFKKMQSLIISADRLKQLSAQMSGTTCTIIIHESKTNKIHVAHVADSSAALGQRGRGIQLTRDHKPDLPDERKRIESSGGRVVFDGYANHRVYAKNGKYPGLNMSRCLGDLLGHADCGLSCIPEVTVRQLGPDDDILLVCSDGVWEFMDPDEVMRVLSQFGPDEAMQAAEKLAKEAWDRWIKEEGGQVVDDITVVLAHLKGRR